ncbi:MAG: WxcM-like domain-containing protein [Myxococcaceae bacterium]|nr:WxcM-like domain-containing protein [Myxococcaceae bacterium]
MPKSARIDPSARLGPGCTVEDAAVVEAGAEVAASLTVGYGAVVGAGARVTQTVPPYGRVAGSPARVVGLVETASGRALPGGSRAIDVAVKRDALGALTFLEEKNGLPFVPRRYFTLSELPDGGLRGAHAHRVCQQYFACLAGAVSLGLDDGTARAVVRLERPEQGLHVPAGVWVTVFQPAAGTALLVLASEPYLESDYVRRYADFRALKGLS